MSSEKKVVDDNIPSTSKGVTTSSGSDAAFRGIYDDSSDEDNLIEDVDLNNLEKGESDADSKSTLPSSSSVALTPLPSEKVGEKIKQESIEFAFLQPICAKLLQDPSETNLRVLEERVEAVGMIPTHLSEFVTFPFAIHLKVVKNYKEPQRIQIYRTLGKVLLHAELRASFEMFVNIFQKLHLVLCTQENMMKVNKLISEEELRLTLECIKNVTEVSMPYHMDQLCAEENVKNFGHSIYILLQLVTHEFSRHIRLTTLDILNQMVELCDGKENRSNVLFKFLPGLISALRKISIPSAGNSLKAVVVKSIALMGQAIRVCTEFESSSEVTQADGMLSQIIELLSKEFVLSPDLDYRRSFYNFCGNISCRYEELPICAKTISTILLRMKEDGDTAIAEGCVDILSKLGVVQVLSFEDLTNLIQRANSHLQSGDDIACILALREASSVLSTKKLTFIEFKCLLPLVFDFINEVVWKFRKNIALETTTVADPVFVASTKLCTNLVSTENVDEIVYEFSTIIPDLQKNFESVKVGTIVSINLILGELFSTKPEAINEYEAATYAEVYLTLIDMQSTEIVLKDIASDIPATQSAAEIRRAYLLEGLGILGRACPQTVIPIILYPLIEHAGSCNSEVVNETSEQTLQSVASPMNISDFLNQNIDFIMNEISVRMLNLILYPNCPNALIFLAQYFDFSKDSFAVFVDNVFEQCSDKFGGGNVQHIYVKIFYAIMKSISNHLMDVEEGCEKEELTSENKSLLQKLVEYQNAIGVIHPSVTHAEEEEASIENNPDSSGKEDESEVPEDDDAEEKLDPVQNLVLRTSHRVLNFLPNPDRSVRLTAMDCLILGLPVLKHHENSILPLSHTIWQNLVPRLDEKDYVTVRKSFELLRTLCVCCGGFLKKRTIEEAFPKLSTLLLTLAKDSEQVKSKNRQYYTYTQAYKLQLTVLQGMGILIDAIDVQEFELDKIVSGCIMYLNPDQHKNLREAAMQLLERISCGKRCRTVWMKLVAYGIKTLPESIPHPEFIIPPNLQ